MESRKPMFSISLIIYTSVSTGWVNFNRLNVDTNSIKDQHNYGTMYTNSLVSKLRFRMNIDSVVLWIWIQLILIMNMYDSEITVYYPKEQPISLINIY